MKVKILSNKNSKAFQTALSIIQAELTAERLAEKIQPFIEKPEKPEPTPTPKPVTKIYRWKDETVKDRKVLVDEEGSGKLVKLRIVSPSSNFNVLLVLDGETLIDDSYADLTETLAAYEEDDAYYLHLEDKAFKKRLLLVVTVTEETTFTLLYAEVLMEK